VILQDASLVGSKDGRVLVVGWVEEHEVGRLLGGDDDEEIREQNFGSTETPTWEDEDALVKQKEEELLCT